MLNEIKAFEEYTCDLSTKKACRLNEIVFKNKNNLNGLSGAMTVIARGELGLRGYFQASEDKQGEIIKQVIECLREWVGFAEDSSEIITKYNGWLKRYYEERIISLDNSKGKTQIKPWDRIKKDKQKQYEAVLINTSCDVKEHSNLAITYERIVADAIFLGPLKRYYLVFRTGAISSLTKNKKPMDPKKPKNGEQIENTLKLISAYLIKKRYTGNNANVVNNADLANWAQCYNIFHDGCVNKKKNGYFDGIMYKNDPVFTHSITVANNRAKIIVNSDYIKDFDFKIVPEGEFSGVEEDYVFYSDNGCGVPLELNKEY